ncbi:MAG: hypothetical protein JWO27_1143 [Frankiales bacterium]|nr:hypothetical protein [Frankiales bacterium]
MNRRMITTTGVAAGMVALTATAALASWGATAAGSATAKSTAMPAGSQPTKPVATAPTSVGTIVVQWTVANYPTVTPTTPVPGYVVKRYKGGVLDGTGPAGNCTGTVAALTCSDTVTVDGAYTYTVTPVSGTSNQWKGAESPASAVYNYSAATATFFALSPSPATVKAGSATTVTVTARKPDNSTDTNYTGTLTWSGSAFANSPNGSTATAVVASAFSNGVATYTITPKAVGGFQQLTATQGSITGSTNFTVNRADVQLTLTCPSSAPKGNPVSLTLGRPSTDAFGNPVTAASGQSVAVSVSATNVSAGATQLITIASASTSQTFNEALSSANQVVTVVTTNAPSGYTAANSCSVTHT